MFEDEEDDFNSDDDPHIKTYREKHQFKEQSDSEVEVFGVGSDDDSESDNQSDIALSDVEGQDEDDDIPDARAWGKEKRKYYGADYVDPDYGGFQGKDALAAEAEQNEANELQNQLMTKLVGDFSADTYSTKKAAKIAKKKTDLLKPGDIKQKPVNLKKESPELFMLKNDFKANLRCAADYLYPIIEASRTGKIQHCKAVDFVYSHYQLVLNYAINIYMYLLLHCNDNLKNHPVTQRLFQYRQLLSEVEPVFEEVVKPQISLFLEQSVHKEDNTSANESLKSRRKKTLKLLQNIVKTQSNERQNSDQGQQRKKIKLDVEGNETSNKKSVHFKIGEHDSDSEVSQDADQIAKDEESQVAEGNDEVAKRAITYQMAKNRGLAPHRKKELRNPRVKHKLKFRKALIRRKGAVREPRKELTRYSGEISGIKTSVSKSIKIRS